MRPLTHGGVFNFQARRTELKHEQAILDRAIHLQSTLTGNPASKFGRSVAEVLFRTLAQASTDVDMNRSQAPVYFVPAPTGAGKTTFTCALIAAALEADPEYSAVIATETIAGAIAVHGYLSNTSLR